MKVLMVLTSHDELGDTGKKTGFWVEEFAAPYYVLADAGADITLASPKGGQPPVDPSSTTDDAQTEATKRFDKDKDLQEKLSKTKKLEEVKAEEPALALEAIEGRIPAHGLLHIGHRTHDKLVEAAPDVALPARHGGDVGLHGRVAVPLGNLRVAT